MRTMSRQARPESDPAVRFAQAAASFFRSGLILGLEVAREAR